MEHEREKEPPLKSETLSRFLTLGFLKERRPVDELLELLRLPGGAELSQTLLRESPAAAYGPPDEKLAGGSLSLAELKSVKEEAKRLLAKAQSREDRLAALLAYLLCAAAGLAHHQTLIVSRDREELDPVFLDLSAVLPEPWSGLLARAIRS